MSKNSDGKEGRLKRFFVQNFPSLFKKNNDSDDIRSDLNSSTPTPPKRKPKQNAPQQPTKRSKESASIGIEHTNEDLSKLNIRQNNINLSVPPNHTSSEHFQIENENKRGESSKSGKQYTKNPSAIKNVKVQNNPRNDNIGTTKSKNLDHKKVGGSITPESERSKFNVRQPIHDSSERFPREKENKRGGSSNSGKQDTRNQSTIKDDQVKKNSKKDNIENTKSKNVDYKKVNGSIIPENERSKLNVRQPIHDSPEHFPRKKEDKHGGSSNSEKQDTRNQNSIKNDQVQKNSKNDNIENTKKVSSSIIPESEPARVENELQKSSRNKQLTIAINNSGGQPSDTMVEKLHQEEEKSTPSQILEDAPRKLENERLNSPKEDDTNKSLNKDEIDMALQQIDSVMEEVTNAKLEMQNLNNPEDSFIFESVLTNAMIKLDSIQMSKNELVKEKRKKGILFIQEVFRLLDEQQEKEIPK